MVKVSAFRAGEPADGDGSVLGAQGHVFGAEGRSSQIRNLNSASSTALNSSKDTNAPPPLDEVEVDGYDSAWLVCKSSGPRFLQQLPASAA